MNDMVRVPKNLIVIDFDLKKENGIHLHYIYSGEISVKERIDQNEDN